ncbi:MAG: hypothetical protein GY807_24045 [Gammaproteobacteria bacterium]|nr:hypothetical protein [Gammaproteobacteria bacterium]
MTLSKQTSEALEASIEHWKKNARCRKPEDVKVGSRHCALCDEFKLKHCIGCPVMMATRLYGCDDSPYEAAIDALDKWHGNGLGARLTFVKAAKAEIAFLESLREPKAPRSAHGTSKEKLASLLEEVLAVIEPDNERTCMFCDNSESPKDTYEYVCLYHKIEEALK